MSKCRYPDCETNTLEGRNKCPKHRGRERRGIFTDDDLLYGRGYIRDACGRKQCYICVEWLPESSFMRDGTGKHKDGLATMCRKCKAEIESWAKRQKKYGLSKEQLISCLDTQDWACPICHDDLRVNRFSVDHDHSCCSGPQSCGKCIRGIICQRCNAGLGMFRDSLSNVLAAAAYLKGFEIIAIG